MKLFFKSFLLLVVLCIVASVPSNAGDKKDKVAIMHNGHIIVVAPEAVPAHLRHGDVLVTNDILITVTNYNPNLGTIVGPTSVPSGGSATYDIIPDLNATFALVVDGVFVWSTNGPYTYTLLNVTTPHVIEVSFWSGG